MFQEVISLKFVADFSLCCNMNFFQAKFRVVFFVLMIFYLAATAQGVRANISDYKQDDTKLPCPTKSIESRCRFENESTVVMIDLEGGKLIYFLLVRILIIVINYHYVYIAGTNGRPFIGHFKFSLMDNFSSFRS